MSHHVSWDQITSPDKQAVNCLTGDNLKDSWDEKTSETSYLTLTSVLRDLIGTTWTENWHLFINIFTQTTFERSLDPFYILHILELNYFVYTDVYLVFNIFVLKVALKKS